MSDAKTRSAAPFLPLENPLARAARDARYRFALDRLRGGRVLEAGCGARDGAVQLAARAVRVVAVDLSSDGTRLAAQAHPHPRVQYACMDCQHLGFREASFDVIVSFEVVEHVPDSHAYIQEMARVLRSGGWYIGSTPNRDRRDFRPNPDHVREFSSSEYRSLLSRHFACVELHGQHPRPIVEGRAVDFRRALTRRDRSGLRLLIPQRVKDAVNRRLFHLKSAHLVGPEDYAFRPDRLEEATVLVCVCRR